MPRRAGGGPRGRGGEGGPSHGGGNGLAREGEGAEAPRPPHPAPLRLLSTRYLLAWAAGALALAAAATPSGPPDDPEGTPAALALLLSSHGRALWWDAATGAELSELHSGGGVYYGVLPGAPLPADDPEAPGGATTWVVNRAHNWRGTEGSGRERLLQLAGSGRVAGEAPFSARFSHDAVLAPAEGGSPARALVADTGGGAVVELDPGTMAEVRRHEVFTRRDHVNTLAPSLARPGHVWALLHGKGAGARLALVDLAEGRVVHETRRFGADCHGLVMLRRKRAPDGMPANREWEAHDGGLPLEDRWLTLNSGEGQVLVLEGLEEEALGGPPMRAKVLWADAEETFMKGLAAVDGVAYFGISEWGDRDERASPKKRAEVAAFDLNAGFLLWRRWVDTRGLLNVVSAPQLGATSTYRESASWAPAPAAGDFSRQFAGASLGAGSGSGDEGGGGGSGTSWDGGAGGDSALGETCEAWPDRSERQTLPYTQEVPPPPPPAPQPARPWLALECKVGERKRKESCGSAAEQPLQLPRGVVDVAPLQAHLRAHPELWNKVVQAQRNVLVQGREKNQETFKPGVGQVMLIFSSSKGDEAFTFPWWEELRPLLEPVLAPLLEPLAGDGWARHLLRVQFARMPAGSEIKTHVDRGQWTRLAHRVHVPVIVPEGVVFRVRSPASGKFEALELREGHAFELNNRFPHNVRNDNRAGEERVHLVVDVSDGPAPDRPLLSAGSACAWIEETIRCVEQRARQPGGA